MPVLQQREENIQRGLLWLGLMLGFAVRLFQLGRESLWYDEAVSVYLAQQSIPELIAHTARDIHPPGYYLILHVWQQLSHPSLAHGLEFLFAWPSLFAGMLLLPLLYSIGRRWFSPWVAVSAVWIAALHPFQVWYSQEVRMYTVAAALGLLCLWSLLKWQEDGSQRRYLVVYAVAAAASLYTLYYSAFLLIALNLIVLTGILKRQLSPRQVLQWGIAQLSVIALWSPWLPIFWRQVTTPPVPPWRGDPNLIAALNESFAAILVGQSPPTQSWVWGAAGFVLVLAGFGYTNSNRKASRILIVYIFVPLMLILLLSLTVTPLYHVRYFFTYAAAAPLLLAAAIHAVGRNRPARLSALAVLLTISGWSLIEFHKNPDYRADDHRSAVAMLATQWRPGDAILANAGWVYPVIEVYWPSEPSDAVKAVPPPLQGRTRLTDYANRHADNREAGPILVTTGSVDGSATLGWGQPQSDFYAMAADPAVAALDQLAVDHPRIWHYRLYDTVSDPTGLLRATLDGLGTLTVDQPFPGRDFVRLQRYDIPTTEGKFCPDRGVTARYDDVLLLVGSESSVRARPGEMLYATLCWEALEAVSTYPGGLRASLRLYDENDQMVAQIDDGPVRATSTWQPGERGRLALGLPIPASVTPGRFSLDLIVYDGSNGEPLLPGGDHVASGQRLRLATVDVDPTTTRP